MYGDVPMTTSPGGTRRRWHRLLAALLALAMVAAACGDDDGTADGGTDGTTAETTTEAAGGATDDDGDEATEAASGGNFRYAYPIGPSRFDAHRSTVGQDIRIFTLVYDRLVHYDDTGAFVPGLATEWSFNDDGSELELQLRQGVVFHDGEPFDAEAVKANIERGKTVEGSSVATDLADIDEVRVVDEHTVVLELAQPNSMLPGLLSSRAGVMISPAAFDSELDFAPVGAGPYRVAEYRVDDVIRFERFDDHWDDAYGGPDTVEWRILADEATRLNALRSGEVDAALISGAQLTEAEAAGFTVDSRATLSYFTLFLNRAKVEFDKLEVRQALSHAIDREAFVQVVFEGAGEPNVQDFPEGYFAFNPDYPPDHYAYDPDRARELLAEAGVDGFEFEMLVPALTAYVTGSQVLQQMLAEIGITVTLRQIEAAAAGDIFFAQEDGDAMIAQFGGRPDPQITMNLQYSAEGFLNAGDHTTPEFERLNTETKATLDPEDRQEMLQAMQAEVVENAFTIPLANDYNNNAYSDAVQGFNLLAGGEMDFRNMSVGA
jgi:peptide/nickel transport system substrate-binding protein